MAQDRPGRSGSSKGPRFGKTWTLAACLLVLLVETWVFLYRCTDWDLAIYHEYAQTCRQSSLGTLYSRRSVEYPPLAVLLMLGTDAVARQLPDCTALGGVFAKGDQRPESFASYKLAYRLEMAAVTFATFLLLLYLVRQYLPHEAPSEWGERLGTFALGVGLLGHFAFDRLDAVLAALMLLAPALLLSRRSFAWSFLVLAAAIAYKVVPAALAPLWVLGSLPAGVLTAWRGSWRRLLAAAAGRGLLLAALTLAFLAPFYLLAGGRSLVFVSYHRDRGIECESTYAAVLGVLHHLTGLPTITHPSYGGRDVASSLSPVLTALAPVLTGALVVGATLLFAGVHRAGALGPRRPGAPARPAHASNAEFIASMLLVLMIFLLTNKVFSPQFVLWLTPFVPLVPLAGWRRRLFQAGFLGLCLVTYLICPRWMGDVFGKGTPSDPSAAAGASAFGVALLASRTVLLVGLIRGLTGHLVSRLRPSAVRSGALGPGRGESFPQAGGRPLRRAA
jgi:hypothetical protein